MHFVYLVLHGLNERIVLTLREIARNDHGAIEFVIAHGLVKLFFAGKARPLDGAFLPFFRGAFGDLVHHQITQVHVTLVCLDPFIETNDRERKILHLHVRHRIENERKDARYSNDDAQRQDVFAFPQFFDHRYPLVSPNARSPPSKDRSAQTIPLLDCNQNGAVLK